MIQEGRAVRWGEVPRPQHSIRKLCLSWHGRVGKASRRTRGAVSFGCGGTAVYLPSCLQTQPARWCGGCRPSWAPPPPAGMSPETSSGCWPPAIWVGSSAGWEGWQCGTAGKAEDPSLLSPGQHSCSPQVQADSSSWLGPKKVALQALETWSRGGLWQATWSPSRCSPAWSI